MGNIENIVTKTRQTVLSPVISQSMRLLEGMPDNDNKENSPEPHKEKPVWPWVLGLFLILRGYDPMFSGMIWEEFVPNPFSPGTAVWNRIFKV